MRLLSQKSFPLREQLIPSLGIKCSQPGNKTFPYWEYILSLMTYLEDNIRSRLFCVGFEICTVKIWLFRKKYVSLQSKTYCLTLKLNAYEKSEC